jgi:ATP-dependent DNA ligase
MLDKGYKKTVEEAQQGSTNQLNLPRPMLAQPLKRVSRVNYKDAVLQFKLDGHRCLVTRVDGKVIAYTRQGKLIPSITHITQELDDILPEGVTLDGELYHHGTPLQTIGSWIKREQEDTKKLKYTVYDLMSPDPYRERMTEKNNILARYILRDGNPVINVLGDYEYVDTNHTSTLFRLARSQGYEGLMLRTNDRGYEAGVRSASLIKLKEFFDEEFKVVDITPSKDGWAVCTCVLDSGRTFMVSAPGDMGAKRKVLEERENYLGKFLTVEYSTLTNDGIPFHPNALGWREDV